MAGFSLLNNGAVRELASTILFENIVQSIMVVPGRSADFRYITDVNAKTVTVNRVKETGKARTLVNATNGGYFDSSTGSSESELFEIPLTHVFNTPIKISQVQDDMSGGQALKGSLMNVPKSIGRAINCTYFATLIAANLNDAISATSAEGVVTYAISTDYVTKAAGASAANYATAVYAAMSNLEDGDSAHGFDIFPTEESVLYGNSTLNNGLFGNNNVIVNNPIAQTMMASGAFSAFDAEYTPSSISGYIGEFRGMLWYKVGSLFTSTVGYLALQTLADSTVAATASTALDHLVGFIACGRAIGGGMTPGDVKVVDARGGQGWEIQPNARFGFATFSTKGVQLITDSTGLTASDFKVYTGALAVATNTKKTTLLLPGNRA